MCFVTNMRSDIVVSGDSFSFCCRCSIVIGLKDNTFKKAEVTGVMWHLGVLNDWRNQPIQLPSPATRFEGDERISASVILWFFFRISAKSPLRSVYIIVFNSCRF